jgi:peptidyl-dipeptidase Dcp
MPLSSNPLLSPSKAPFGLPAFAELGDEHFRPAFEAALAEHRTEIARIANDPAAPDFDNTIGALERSGRLLNDVNAVFWNLAATNTNPILQEIERELSGALSRHASEIFMNADLFRRIDALYAQRATLGLTPEQNRVLERFPFKAAHNLRQ